jgi:hypothetical protein
MSLFAAGGQRPAASYEGRDKSTEFAMAGRKPRALVITCGPEPPTAPKCPNTPPKTPNRVKQVSLAERP